MDQIVTRIEWFTWPENMTEPQNIEGQEGLHAASVNLSVFSSSAWREKRA
jgi:hypothetical protein